MSRFLDKIISWSFYLLLFATPLLFYPYSSELFEFNKLILVYVLTVVITGAWIVKMVTQEKFIFRRTILDIPLLIFLGSQLIATFLSIDIRTSIFGYYSRFNGGLVSLVCYSLLYWAYVSNMDRKKTLNTIYILIASAVLVSIYGIFEHFGHSISCLIIRESFDVACWQQDVQNRVFATIGQPNWLAAWLVALLPITWALTLDKKLRPWLGVALSCLFFVTLLYTKSRSGLIGFGIETIIFWSFVLLKNVRSHLKTFAFFNLLLIFLALLIGTPWFSLNKGVTKPVQEIGPALENGGTESSEIRKIVWKGAIDVWKHYPIFGTGVETFAFSYYQFRPAAHNLVSEWDFLYNKAHNEYLNYAATTGTVGLFGYLVFIGATLLLFIKIIFNKEHKDSNFAIAVIAGYVSILVTNAAGFSVVIVSIIFFLYPAISVVLSTKEIVHSKNLNYNKTTTSQKIVLLVFLCTMFYVLFTISRYWLADFYFARGRDLNDAGNYLEARKVLIKAVKLSPKEGVFVSEFSQADGNLAVILSESKKDNEAKTLAQLAQSEADLAINLTPRNLNIKKSAALIYTKMAGIDPSYLAKTNGILTNLVALAPTDPKAKLNLAISYLRLGQEDTAEKLLRETILLKPNYKDARFALAAILADKGSKKEAAEELKYILEKIDPKDGSIKSFLEDVEKM